jgi:hypothetical protein
MMHGHLNVKMYSCSSSHTTKWICVSGTFHDTATAIIHYHAVHIPFTCWSLQKSLRLVQPIFIARLDPRICSTQGTTLTALRNYHLPRPYAHIIKIFFGGFKPSSTMLCHPTQHQILLHFNPQLHSHKSFKSHKSFIFQNSPKWGGIIFAQCAKSHHAVCSCWCEHRKFIGNTESVWYFKHRDLPFVE